VRTDGGPIALRAFWSVYMEVMNWSGMGRAEYAAALGLSPHALRIWRDRLEESCNGSADREATSAPILPRGRPGRFTISDCVHSARTSASRRSERLTRLFIKPHCHEKN